MQVSSRRRMAAQYRYCQIKAITVCAIAVMLVVIRSVLMGGIQLILNVWFYLIPQPHVSLLCCLPGGY